MRQVQTAGTRHMTTSQWRMWPVCDIHVRRHGGNGCRAFSEVTAQTHLKAIAIVSMFWYKRKQQLANTVAKTKTGHDSPHLARFWFLGILPSVDYTGFQVQSLFEASRVVRSCRSDVVSMHTPAEQQLKWHQLDRFLSARQVHHVITQSCRSAQGSCLPAGWSLNALVHNRNSPHRFWCHCEFLWPFYVRCCNLVKR